MIHYTCDVCGKPVGGDEVRYEVSIEIKAAVDAPEEPPEASSRPDVQDEMHEILDLMGELDGEQIENEVYRSYRFDLCGECRRQYMKDPLFRASLQRLEFRDN